MRAVGDKLLLSHLDKMIGTRHMILVEQSGFAHTENFSLVAAPGLKPRDMVPVMMTGHNGKHLTMQVDAAAAA